MITENNLMCAAGIVDDAWFLDCDAEIDDSTDNLRSGYMARYGGDAIDAVLKGYHPRVRGQERSKAGCSRLRIPHFDTEDDDVDRFDFTGIVGCPDGKPGHTAQRTLDREAIALQCCEVGTPRDQGDLVSTFGKPPAYIGTDGTCAHDSNFHAVPPAFKDLIAGPPIPFVSSEVLTARM